jgi:tRNA C32,U32 (ribose-2'-O)-methylase TrmJ
MSIEEMTQEEWDEHREQLDKYLTGVEERHIARLGVAMGFDREWVGLTNEEILEIDQAIDAKSYTLYSYTRAIEAKLKEKNT